MAPGACLATSRTRIAAAGPEQASPLVEQRAQPGPALAFTHAALAFLQPAQALRRPAPAGTATPPRWGTEPGVVGEDKGAEEGAEEVDAEGEAGAHIVW